MVVSSTASLAEYSSIYERMVGHVADAHYRRDDELTLSAIRDCAEFAWFHHPGRFADGRLENIALEIGQRLERSPPEGLRPGLERTFVRKSRRRRVLHVMTRALELGGHTRIVMSWIDRDRDSDHSVMLSFQSYQPFRRDLEPLVASHGGGFLQMPPEVANLDTIAAIRAVARCGFDLVVLHSHPSDPLPTAAFAIAGGAPVILLDHADHCFWLGSSVADLTVHLRRPAEDLARRRRLVRNTCVLPIPLAARPSTMTRESARRQLQIPAAQPVLLSVGTGYKWTPSGDSDFFRATRQVLDMAPAAHLHMVGLEPDEFSALGLGPQHARLHIHGNLRHADVLAYQLAANVYLEPFPFGSMTATIESVLEGCAPVLGPMDDSPILSGAGDANESRLTRPRSESEWVAEAVALLGSPSAQVARSELLAAAAREEHQGVSWHARLERVYQLALAADHCARPLPVGAARMDPEDLVLARFALACSRGRLPSSKPQESRP